MVYGHNKSALGNASMKVMSLMPGSVTMVGSALQNLAMERPSQQSAVVGFSGTDKGEPVLRDWFDQLLNDMVSNGCLNAATVAPWKATDCLDKVEVKGKIWFPKWFIWQHRKKDKQVKNALVEKAIVQIVAYPKPEQYALFAIEANSDEQAIMLFDTSMGNYKKTQAINEKLHHCGLKLDLFRKIFGNVILLIFKITKQQS